MAFGARKFQKGGKAAKTASKSGGRGSAASSPHKAAGFGRGDDDGEQAQGQERSTGFHSSSRGKSGGGQFRGGGGGGGRGGKKPNSEFMRITGLFKSQSGKSYQAFVKRDILDALANVQEGDYIGVSFTEIKGEGAMSLWASRPTE